MTAGEEPTPAAGDPGQAPYRVLARKYRPQTFDELIGQDAMVRILTNAFATGRIAQAYMLTGVRGVGKTTTARILARALNYEGPEGITGPSIELAELGIHCPSIIESRHPDVIEMDAASNTGIADIRELIEGARYRPISARYKVYIIDEVHMLSRQAFDGLLKTLEEPPEHVRFIFATTEARKVPVTVLSRCQRFDLRRVDAEQLIGHFAEIANKEDSKVEPAALALIARAAEGSVRDGLSLLDQAIALGRGEVVETDVRQMLGLADRVRVVELFEQVMRGETAAALAELKEQYDAGADPLVVLADLAEFVHLVTRARVTEAALADPSLPEAARERAKALALVLDMGALARAWQMLLKGLGEVEIARNPLAAADMVLIRLAHAAALPPPAELIRSLRDETREPAAAPTPTTEASPTTSPPPENPTSASGPATNPLPSDDGATPVAATPVTPIPVTPIPVTDAPMPANFVEAVRLVGDHDIRLIDALERVLRPVSFEAGRIEVALTDDAPADLVGRFAATLKRATGVQWVVSIVGDGGGATISEARAAGDRDRQDAIENHPVVRSVKTLFPGAEVVAVRDLPNRPTGDTDGDVDSETSVAPVEQSDRSREA